jgi:hypothetical protein
MTKVVRIGPDKRIHNETGFRVTLTNLRLLKEPGSRMKPPKDVSLNQKHFDVLASIRGDGCEWTAGRVPCEWAKHVGLHERIVTQLPDIKICRANLLDFCKDVSCEVAVAAIFAWGGMKVSHGRRVSSVFVWERLIDIGSKLKSGDVCRKSAYEMLWLFRAQNRGCGLGPAYFTKLIYFLNPRHNGYIMDQWTSLSVNLLFNRQGSPIVDLSTSTYRGRRTDTVSDKNSPDSYVRFCLCIEELARELQTQTPSEAEEWIFSKGGRYPAPWRAHVIANRP